MKIRLLGIGKTNEAFIEEGISHFEQRLVKYNPFETEFLQGLKKSGKLSEQEQNNQEGQLLLKQIQDQETIILLDHTGKTMNSPQFAKYIDQLLQHGGKRLTFVIGGAYGFSPALQERADGVVSLSPMTFSHQIVRLVFLEQLYRAMTILRNEPYHH